jgi:hypothetical protein
MRLRKPIYLAAGVGLLAALAPWSAPAARTSSPHSHIDCASAKTTCTEVLDSEQVFGNNVYVGHDEPSLLFYSTKPGSGSHMTYNLTLPADPSATGNPRSDGKSYNFELHPAFWFGMAMCDDQSYPESMFNGLNATPCTTTDNNIPGDTGTGMAHAPGVAFMEMQFYPPGWAEWPPGVSCDPTKWCAALNIDSLSEDPVTGQVLNSTCAAKTGLEYVNFAFITHDGVPIGPPNPVDATFSTFNPVNNSDVSFFNSGDQLSVALADTTHGLGITITDSTHPGQSGLMVASAANNFGMVNFAPTGTSCTNIPYDFHPMYSTSSETTRVQWAAHSYNIAFSDEIGHFDFCGNVQRRGTCGKSEGLAGDTEPSDKDDTFCFPAGSLGALVQTAGCIGTNTGFDGMPYQNVWPDGNANHPAPVDFSSPLTGGLNYDRVAFETDLPRIEVKGVGGANNCNRTTGTGCINPPLSDDGAAAAFYPFYSTAAGGSSACTWVIGNQIPFNPTNAPYPIYTTNSFGGNPAEYGPLYRSTYLAFPSGSFYNTSSRYNNFHNGQPTNPCAAPTP